MEICFTRHARQRMQERGIDESEVRHALQHQEVSLPAGEPLKRWVYSTVSGKRLKVLYLSEPDGKVLVITAAIRE